MFRRRGRLMLALLVATICASCAAESMDSGPLEFPPDHGYEAGVVEVGVPFSDGFELFHVEEGPVTIVSVELIETDPAIQLVDVLSYGEGSEITFQMSPEFPPVVDDIGPLTPAVGATWLPREEKIAQGFGATPYGLIFGLEVTEPGKWVRGGYRLEYEVDGRVYRRDVVAEITVCTPEFAEPDGQCPMSIPEGAD